MPNLTQEKSHENEPLAIHGGQPVRTSVLPYGRQSISEEDIASVVETLRSPWLTTGPKVKEFEAAFAHAVEAKEAVAVSNGTAALHCAFAGLKLKAGDEVIVSSLTFVASANAVLYTGAKPVFCDVDPKTLLIDPAKAEKLINEKTKAILAVDFAGQPCDYDRLAELCNRYPLHLVSDACHALGASYGAKGQERKVGSLADATAFSLHPVKHITTGEGGVITTDDPELANRMRTFRNHGITSDFRARESKGTWAYEMVELGFNYRLPDFACALGISQLKNLSSWVERRRELAKLYRKELREVGFISSLEEKSNRTHSYHLFVVRLSPEKLRCHRDEFFAALRAENIGVNVHYSPVHLHPFYQNNFGTRVGLCPEAEKAANEILTLPLFPMMSDKDVVEVCTAIRKVGRYYFSK